MKDHVSRITHHVTKALTALVFLFGLFGSVAPLPVVAQTTPLCCKCVKAGRNVCVNVTLPAGESAGANCSGLTGTQTFRNMVGDRQALFEGFSCNAVLDAQGCTVNGTNASSQCPANTPVELAALGGYLTAASATPTAGGTETPAAALPFQPIVPVLGVPIPGLTFTPATQEGGVVTLPYLAEYINTGYRYLVGVILVVAIIMVVWGGFRYLLGSANVGNISRAKEIIRDAIAGMLIVIGAYVILQTVNPATTDLRSLELSSVAQVSYDLSLDEFGSFGDETAYSGGVAADGAEGVVGGVENPASVVRASPGTWRARMMEVCQGNAASLTVEQRRQELRRIVDVWKRVGLDQGGAIYVRGGNPSCSSSHPQASWLQAKLRTQSAFTAALPAECRAATASVPACLSPWRQAYDRLLREPAQAAGLFCGDCFTTVMQIYRCLGGSTFHQRVRAKRFTGGSCGSSANGYVFKLQDGVTDAQRSGGVLDLNNESDRGAAAGRLRFGDVIAWTKNGGGHVFLYTGGANLGYEILEMGGGLYGEAGASGGGARAIQNSGTTWSGSVASGFVSHRSALTYMNTIARRDATCLYAWRPIEP